MRRTSFTWILFLLCLALAAGAMGWISTKVVQLDRAAADSRRQSAIEENVRLALWRMDSTLAPIIAQENSRPSFAYDSFFPAHRAYAYVSPENRNSDVLPSPILAPTSELILLHFQLSPHGQLTSPQAPPAGNIRNLAEARYTTHEAVLVAERRLGELQPTLDYRQLLAQLPVVKPLDESPIATARNPNLTGNGSLTINNTGKQTQGNNKDNQNIYAFNGAQQADNPQSQQMRGQAEFQARANSVQQYANDQNWQRAPTSAVTEGYMQPVWVGSALLLARRVRLNGDDFVQGVWFDYPAVKQLLLQRVGDLLPQADLVPVYSPTDDKQPHMLAALPLRLVPGNVPLPPDPRSPIDIMLIIAWASAITGAIAVAILLRGVIALSNRRASFVSAVTHELRTPLTTLRMYTEMLSDGMVADEQQRSRYLTTLRNAANRLGHLVENVLGYSRLERRRNVGRIETAPLPDVIDNLRARLADHANQNELQLEVRLSDEAKEARVTADLVAVEQTLFNLVDNACKYARPCDPPVIRLEARRDGKFAEIRVIDNGPGLSRKDRRKLFRPFSKSVTEAANSAPGLGLGLALSRRFARNMSGDLRIEESQETGACFVLRVPLADD